MHLWDVQELPTDLPTSPHNSPHLPTPPHITPHLPTSPCAVLLAHGTRPLWQQPPSLSVDLARSQVVEHFCRLAPGYLPLILSCNQPLGSDSSRWCAACDKCAFVFALLSAFVEPERACAVFGDDLFETRDAAGLQRAVLPCLRTAPHRPPWTLCRLRRLLRTSERHLSSWNAGLGPGVAWLRPLQR